MQSANNPNKTATATTSQLVTNLSRADLILEARILECGLRVHQACRDALTSEVTHNTT